MNQPNRRVPGSRPAALGPHEPEDGCGLLQAVRRAGRTTLSDFESKQVLALHGIRCVETRLTHNEDEAVLAAAQLGFSVTLKLHSHTLLRHRDRAELQATVADDRGVRRGWEEIRQRVIERHGRQHFIGVSVQPALAGEGREYFLHGKLRAGFRPVLRYGEARFSVSPATPAAGRGGRPGKATATGRLAEIEWTAIELPANEASQFDRLQEDFRRLLAANPGIKEIDLRPLALVHGQLLVLGAQIELRSR